MSLKKLLTIALTLSLFVPSVVHADISDVCLNDAHSPCCLEWQKRFNNVDDLWTDFWQKMVSQPSDSSENIAQAVAAMRGYNCQLREVCENVDFSLKTNAEQRKEKQFITMIGCYRAEDKQEYDFIKACDLQLEVRPATDLPNSCFERAEDKVQEKMVLTKSLLRKDAAHKKTGFIVTRLRNLMKKIRDDLLDNVETMVQRFDKLSRKIACTIEQCD